MPRGPSTNMTKRNILLVLCGRAGTGKDAFAAPLLEHLGFSQLKFARPLKDAMLCLFPHMDERHVDGELKDTVDSVTGATPRALMQVIGTDLLQHGIKDRFPGVGRRIFADALARRAEKMACDIVVTDMRFSHELQAVRAMRAVFEVVVVKITRSSEESMQLQTSDCDHESETPIPDRQCDYIIHNDGPLLDLQHAAEQLVASLR